MPNEEDEIETNEPEDTSEPEVQAPEYDIALESEEPNPNSSVQRIDE